MLVHPRVLQHVYALLSNDPVLAAPDTLPGGVWLDSIPEEQRAYPVLVFSHVGTTPNVNTPPDTPVWDVVLDVQAADEGTDIGRCVPALDRADVLLRRIGLNPDGTPIPGGQQTEGGVALGPARRLSEMTRTAPEATVFFAHLGAQYRIPAAEPALKDQS